MTFFKDISNHANGAVVLTPAMCEQLDYAFSQAISAAVTSGMEAAKRLQEQGQKWREQPIMSYADFRKMFGVEDNTIRAWAAEGNIRIIGVGNRKYITTESVEEMIYKQFTKIN